MRSKVPDRFLETADGQFVRAARISALRAEVVTEQTPQLGLTVSTVVVHAELDGGREVVMRTSPGDEHAARKLLLDVLMEVSA